VIDPQIPALLPFLSNGGSGEIETSSAGGVLFVQSADGRSIQRMNTADFQASDFLVNPGPVLDFLASPSDTI
jgi:hypothetical protein